MALKCEVPVVDVKSVEETFSNVELQNFSNLANILVKEVLYTVYKNKNLSIVDLNKKDVIKDIYGEVAGLIGNIILYKFGAEVNDSDLPSLFNKDKILKLNKKTIKKLQKLLDNIDIFKQYHMRYGGIFNVISKEQTITDETIEEEASNSNQEIDEEIGELPKVDSSIRSMQDKSPVEKDTYITADKNLKVLFKLLYSTTWNNKTKQSQINLNGDKLPIALIDKNAYNIFIKYFNNIRNEQELIDKLNDPIIEQIIPFVKQIREMLRIGDPNQTVKDKKLFLSLLQQTSMPEVRSRVLVTAYNEDTQTTVDLISSPITGNRKKISNLWISNFNKSNSKNKTKYGKRYLVKEEIDRSTSTITSAYRILESIGIEMSKSVISSLPNKEAIQAQIMQAADSIKTELLKVFDATSSYPEFDIITQPIQDLKSRFSQNPYIGYTANPRTYLNLKKILSKNINKEIEGLIDIESEISSLIPSNSGRNAVGELTHNISEQTNITIGINAINKSETEKELLSTPIFAGLKYNPYWKNSFYRNTLFPSGIKNSSKSLVLGYVSGTTSNVNGNKSQLIRKLSSGEKLVHDFKTLIGFNTIDVMRLETSSSYPSITLQTENQLFIQKKSQALFDIEEFQYDKILRSEKLQNLFLGYLNSEIEKVNSYVDKKMENSSITKLYGEFLIFDKLTEDLKGQLRVVENPIALDSRLFNKVLKEYEVILQKKADDYKRRMLKEVESFKELLPSNLSDEFNPYNEEGELDKKKANTLINAFVVNSMVHNIEFSIMFLGDASLYETLDEKTGEVTSSIPKRSKMLGSTGKTPIVSPVANDLIDNDVHLKTLSLGKLRSISTSKKLAPKDPTDLYTLTLKDILYDGSFEPYKDKTDTKTGDGSGWGNPDFAYELSIRQQWNNEYTDAIFNYESLIFKRDFTSIMLSSKELEDISLHERNVAKNPDKYALPVMKGGYAGNQKNSTVDGRVYHKFAIPFLLPSFVSSSSNPKLRKLLMDMLDNQLDYVTFASGSKAYKHKTVDIDNINKSRPDILHKELFKLQLDYSNESNTDTAIPTQFLKLVYSNEFSKGEAANKTIGLLYNDYLKTLGIIQKENINQLFVDLGILVSDDDVVTVDAEKFTNKIYKLAQQREMDPNVLSVLKYNSDTKTFSKDPERFGYIGELEKILSGLVDKTLRKFKVAGGDFVLVTNALSDKLNFYYDKKGKIVSAETRITFTKQHHKLLNLLGPDGKKIETLYNLNKILLSKDSNAIKWKNKYKKSFQIVVDRVPTQELNSMDSLTIVEFISPSMGNIIQLPVEIVIKAGLDFDYDKEKVLIPVFDNNGNYIEYKKSRKSIQRDIDKITKERDALLDRTQYNSAIIHKNFVTAIKDINSKSDNAKKSYNIIKESIPVLQESIRVTTEEMNSLLHEINREKRSNSLPEVDSFLKAFPSVFGDLESIELNVEFLQGEYLLEQDKQSKNLIELNKTYQEQIKVYKTIQNYFNKHQKLAEKWAKDIKENESEAFIALKSYNDSLIELYTLDTFFADSLNNRIIQNYHKALLQPNRFDALIRPNSSALIKDISEKVSKLTGINKQLPSRDLIFDYISQLDVFDIYNTAKGMLAPHAKINTMEKLFNYSGTKLNTNFIDLSSGVYSGDNPRAGQRKQSRKININLDLLSEEEKKINYSKLGKYDISSKDNVIGTEVQTYNSQGINATVDAASDPFYINLMITYANVGVDILFSSLLKFPYERVKYFLSHPVNLFYAENKNKGKSESEALYKVAKRWGVQKKVLHRSFKASADELKNFNLTNGSKGLTFDVKTNTYIGTNIEILEDITDDTGDIYGKKGFRAFLLGVNNGYALTEKYTNLYIAGKPISSYVKMGKLPISIWEKTADIKNDITKLSNGPMTENPLLSNEIRAFSIMYGGIKISKAVKRLTDYLSFDTQKLNNTFAIVERRKLRSDILESGIISEKELKKLEYNSIISAFKNEDEIEIVFSNYSPIINKNANGIQALIEEYNNSNATKSRKLKDTLPTKISSDFLYSILFNFGEKAKNGYEQITTRNKKDIVERLFIAQLNPEYEDTFKNHPILNELIGNFTNISNTDSTYNPGKVSNIMLNKSSTLTPLERASYIEQFTALLEETEFAKDPKVNQAFMNLVKDLADVSLAQSGLSSSYLSFREFIPISYFEDDFNQAYENYLALTPAQKYYYFDSFTYRFKANNRNYFPTESENQFRQKTYNSKNVYNNKLKNYEIEVVEEDTEMPEDNKTILVKFDRANTLSALKQNFVDGQAGRTMRPEFKGKSTMELVLQGLRTRTTRSKLAMESMMRSYQLDKVTDLIGQIIKTNDDKGNYAFIEITNVSKLTQEYQDATWEKEGWTKDVTDKQVDGEHFAIEFKVVERPNIIKVENNDGTEIEEEFFAEPNEYTEFQNQSDENDVTLPIETEFENNNTSRVEVQQGNWTRKQVEKEIDKVFLFGDNTDDRVNTKYIPKSTQAVIRGLPNAIGIDTKKNRDTKEGSSDTDKSSFFTDNDFPQFKKQVDEAIAQAKNSGKTIVIPAEGIGTGKAQLKERAPKLFDYLNQELDKLKNTIIPSDNDLGFGNPSENPNDLKCND